MVPHFPNHQSQTLKKDNALYSLSSLTLPPPHTYLVPLQYQLSLTFTLLQTLQFSCFLKICLIRFALVVSSTWKDCLPDIIIPNFVSLKCLF